MPPGVSIWRKVEVWAFGAPLWLPVHLLSHYSLCVCDLCRSGEVGWGVVPSETMNPWKLLALLLGPPPTIIQKLNSIYKQKLISAQFLMMSVAIAFVVINMISSSHLRLDSFSLHLHGSEGKLLTEELTAIVWHGLVFFHTTASLSNHHLASSAPNRPVAVKERPLHASRICECVQWFLCITSFGITVRWPRLPLQLVTWTLQTSWPNLSRLIKSATAICLS